MKDIIYVINELGRPVEGFNVFEVDNIIWGVGPNGETIFGLDSTKSKKISISQTTKSLKLIINKEFLCSVNGVSTKKKLSLYILKIVDSKIQELFFRLCLSMADGLNEELMLKNFFNLRDLFVNQSKPSNIELQGLFGELFTLYYLKTNYGLDISCFYQKEVKRKFDFSLNEKKKIEIKTTTRPDRVHHFLNQQLDTERYDIKVISIKLQKDDCGMSLLDIVNECKDVFSQYLTIVLYIEMMVKNIEDSDLEAIRFSLEYAKNNLKIFNGIDIPRVKEKDINGVFNIEYDVDLENVPTISKQKLIDWVKIN